MASEVHVEELIREHIQARRAATNPPTDFHRRLMARLDAAEPRRLGLVPQLAMALAIVLGVTALVVSASYLKSHWSTPPTPAKSHQPTPYTIPSPPAVAASCSAVPRQWASSPPNPAKMLSPTTGWAYGPMRTTDGGAHWLDVSPPSIPNRTPKNDMFFLDATHAWVAESASSSNACVDHVVTFRTVDGGRTWQQAAPIPVRYTDPTDVIWTGYANHTSWFDFIDAQHGWLLLGTGSAQSFSPGSGPDSAWVGSAWRVGDLYRTTDGGLHWTLAAANPGSAAGCLPGAGTVTLHQAAMSFSSRTTGWMIASCGLLVTHDGGVTWGKAATPLPPTEAPVFFDSMHGLAPVGGGVLVTSDGGVSWSVRLLPGDGQAVDFINASEGWAVASGDTNVQCRLSNLTPCNGNFRLYRTRDGGRTWVPGNLTSLAMPAWKWWPPAYLHFVDSSNGFADPGESGLFKTTDAGRTWMRVDGTVQGP